MAFFRSYIAPFLIVLTFLIAMVAVSARIFLPSDMLAPAPIEDTVGTVQPQDSAVEPEATANSEMSREVSGLLPGMSNAIG
ncbi:MAG: hypothetical protein AAGE59_32220 [Cyanobacteria bacterium P01_F01_bin.86]